MEMTVPKEMESEAPHLIEWTCDLDAPSIATWQPPGPLA
jgi:hypothetical protein